ncbi:carbohydrate-binding family 9-like protein [Sphingobacterium sp. SRCM116780]|uniref:carbohydrate-binding family 9-like protein n=1 Tax=Sphingobacterium sp. SRCM116780 TaxID=2907623 RepID=UPI001F38A87B|nr:carbohydrate-binding family 9-like protein [Sphingobacterium sp. SRCM116780]UIR54947.1 carbohydrate-binding family 9-like protein [Sphingobacterium sp. SRCM116780]
MNKSIFIFILSCCYTISYGQNSIKEFLALQSIPKTYAVLKTNETLQIDGKDNENSWAQAKTITNFEDIQGKNFKQPAYKTELKMLWDSTYLYVYAKLYDPHIWADIKKHDEIVYLNNDFEIFLKPNLHQAEYYEVEVNALQTIFDLMLTKPYRFGGEAITHWDLKNLKSAVYVNGSLNNPQDTDSFWSVEFAIPHQSIYAFGKPMMPKPNDYWLCNFSRVQWQHEVINDQYRRKTKNNKILEEDNWVWSPIGLINMHYPERWGYIQFVEHAQEQPPALPETYEITKLAWNIHYLQRLFYKENRMYTNQLSKLSLFKENINPILKNYQITLNLSQDKKNYNMQIVDHRSKKMYVYLDNKGNFEINP